MRMNDLDKFMPGLASTAATCSSARTRSNPNISARKGGPTIPATAPEPQYYYKK